PKPLYQRLLDREVIRDEAVLEEIISNIIKLGKELDKPVVATGNVHYLDESDKLSRDILVKSNPGNPLSRGKLPDAHYRTTDEMLELFDFLSEEVAKEIVFKNTRHIASLIDPVEVIKKDLYPPKIEGAEEEIRQMSYDNAKKLYGEDVPQIVVDRLEKELESIIGDRKSTRLNSSHVSISYAVF